MKNVNTATQSTLVNPTPFECELNKLAIAIKGNEFSLYTLVSHELNTSDESLVKETFNRIMVTDNGFNPSTVARYFTDLKKLSVIASSHVTLSGYKKALKELGIVNMNTANTWLSRESAITIAIRGVNLDNRNNLLSKRNDIKTVSDVRLLLTAIGDQATIDAKANAEAKTIAEATMPTATMPTATTPTATTPTAITPTAITPTATTPTATTPTATTPTAITPTAITPTAITPTATTPTATTPSKKTKVCNDEMFDAVLATMRLMTDLQLKNLQASLLAMTEQRKTGTK